MWNQFTSSFDANESIQSVNGSDVDNSKLFTAHIVANITSSLEVTKNPKVCCVSSSKHIALAIDSQLYIVNEDFSDLYHSQELKSYVDCLALSPDSELLLIGENGGTASILHIQSKRILWSMNLDEHKTEEYAFKGLLFIASSKDFIKICILTAKDELYIFHNINCTGVYKAIEGGPVEEVIADIQEQQLNIPVEFPGFIPYCVYKNDADEDFALGLAGGGDEFTGTKSKEFCCGLTLFNCSSKDVQIKKAYVSTNGRYIIALDTEFHLRILCSQTHFLIRKFDKLTILDFIVIENEDSNSVSGDDMKVCVLIKMLKKEACEPEHFFQVLQFPALVAIYTIPVSKFSILIQGEQNQDCVYIVEGDVSGEIVTSVKVKAVSESSPEAKLSSLLNKKKFPEAEEFAEAHGLDKQLVYRTKMNVLIEELPRSDSSGFDSFITELKDLLTKVKDVAFVKTCVTLFLPSLDQTKEFLSLCMQWLLLDEGGSEEKENLFAKINQTQNRITTYEILSENNCARGHWQEFLKADLLAHFLHDLKHHNILASVILWQKHQAELVVLLSPEKFEEILLAIPESVPSKYLVPFLRNDFFAVVFCAVQEAMNIAAEWLNQRVYLLEINEKDNWPENGIEWLEMFLKVWETLRCSFHKGRISYTTYMELNSIYKQSINKKSHVGRLFQLIQNLKELSLLRNEFGCKLTLSDYCQEDKMSVLFLILDRIQLSSLQQVIPLIGKELITEAELDINSCLHSYIQHTLQQSQITWWHWEAAPWEEKLLVIIRCIQDYNLWMDAAMSIVFKAPVPWSEGVLKLVDIGMSMEHPKKELLKSQLKIVNLKQVLMKYDLRDFPINSDLELARVLANYILKQNGVSALEDVLLVYKAYENAGENEAYNTTAFFLISHDMPHDMMAVLSSMPSGSLTLCSRLLAYAKDILNTSLFLQHKKESCQSAAEAGVLIVQFLKSNHAEIDPNVEYSFHAILRLQKEFDKYVPYDFLSSTSFCWELVNEAIDSVILGKHVLKQDFEERKTATTVPSLSHIYRLGDILCLEREEVMTCLVLKFVEQKQYNKAVNLCKELSCNYKTAKTAHTLMNVAKHIISNFEQVQQLEFSAIVQTLHQIVCTAATYCDESSLSVCRYLWRHTLVLTVIDQLTFRDLRALSVPALSDRAYNKWRFSPLYNDEGFFVEPSYASMLFAKGYAELLTIATESNHIKDCVSHMIKGMNLGKDLISYLKEKGQEVAAIRIIMHTLFFLIPAITKFDKSESAALVKVGEAVQPVLTDTFHSLYLRVVEQNNQDMPMLLGILSLLPVKNMTTTFKDLQKWSNNSVQQSLALYAIAIEFASKCGLSESAENFGKSYEKLSWLSKFARTSISPKEVLNLDHQSEYSLISLIISSQDISIEAVLACSNIFRVDRLDILVIYLNNLLGSKKKWSGLAELPQEEIKKSLITAEKVISQFENQNSILKNLKIMLKNANPYYYEILLFLNQKIAQIYDDLQPEHAEPYKKHIALLEFLLVYKRVSPPSQTEENEWKNKNPLEPLPEISKTRLPFHLLVKGNTFKIINPELRATSASVWLNMGSFLNISSDELIMIAVANTVSNYVAQQKERGNDSVIHLTPDQNFLDMIRELLQKIKNPQSVAAAAVCVMKMLPPGANKVLAAKSSVLLTQRQSSSPNDASIQETVKKLSLNYHSLAAELALHKYNLANEECLGLVRNPKLLIQHLINNYCVPATRSVKICKAIHEIADIINLNPLELYFRFLSSCLTPSQVVITNLDETYISKDDFIKDTGEINDQKNFERAVCLALGVPETTLHSLMSFIMEEFSQHSKAHTARALCCLVSVLEPAVASTICGCSASTLQKSLNVRTCIADLESLRFQLSTKMFVACNKLEFVERILTSFSHNPKALVCCIKLCLEYKIWNAHVWLIILQKMKEMFMVNELEEVLTTATGSLAHIWHTNAYVDAWNYLLSSVFQKGTPDLSNKEILNNLYTVLLRCPCNSLLDYLSIYEKIKELDVFPVEDLNEASSICKLITLLNRYLKGSVPAESSCNYSMSLEYSIYGNDFSLIQ